MNDEKNISVPAVAGPIVPVHPALLVADLAVKAALRQALAELLDAFDTSPDDLPAHEYEAIVDDAKARARKLLRTPT